MNLYSLQYKIMTSQSIAKSLFGSFYFQFLYHKRTCLMFTTSIRNWDVFISTIIKVTEETILSHLQNADQSFFVYKLYTKNKALYIFGY